LTKGYHYTSKDIAVRICQIVGISLPSSELATLDAQELHDVPGEWFKGPF